MFFFRFLKILKRKSQENNSKDIKISMLPQQFIPSKISLKPVSKGKSHSKKKFYPIRGRVFFGGRWENWRRIFRAFKFLLHRLVTFWWQIFSPTVGSNLWGGGGQPGHSEKIELTRFFCSIIFFSQTFFAVALKNSNRFQDYRRVITVEQNLF